VKILIVLASNGWGGAERIGCTLYRKAREHGHEVRLEAPASPGMRAHVRDETGTDLPASDAEVTPFRWARAARERARAFEPDLVHAHLAWPSFASAAALAAARFPLVSTFHLLPSGEWPTDLLVRFSSAALIRALRPVQAGRLMVALSSRDREVLRSRFPKDDVRIVRNAPPLPPLSCARPEVIEWQPGAVRLLSVARICRQKGLDRVARTLASPELRTLPWHWVIIGDGDQRSSLERQLAESALSERVTFAGARPAHELIPTADLLLAPSRSEGMPLVPLEAIQSGVPVIGSRIAPHEELFAGIPGALLPTDEAEWSRALGELVGSESARAVLRDAQARLAPTADPERFWRDHEAIYREVVARRAR
jgi:glycosyltransferase involved in cell wall biosynthesis